MLRRLLISSLVVCALAGCSGSNTGDTGEGSLPDSTNAQAEPTCHAFDTAIQDANGRACVPQDFPVGFTGCMEAWPHCNSHDRSLMLQATNCLNDLPQCSPANQQSFQDRFADCLGDFLSSISDGCFGE